MKPSRIQQLTSHLEAALSLVKGNPTLISATDKKLIEEVTIRATSRLARFEDLMANDEAEVVAPALA